MLFEMLAIFEPYEVNDDLFWPPKIPYYVTYYGQINITRINIFCYMIDWKMLMV